MKELSTLTDLNAVFDQEIAVLYKHSTRCPISAGANEKLEGLLAANPDAPIYKVDVHEARGLSQSISERTGVEHQSPQVIVLRRGKPAWTRARMEISAEGVAEQIGAPA